MKASRLGRTALSLVLLAALAALAGAEEKVPITWLQKKFTPEALPKELGEGPRQAIAAWQAWAAKLGYRFDLDAAARVMLVTPRDNSRGEARMKVIARTVAWFDALLPAPARAAGETVATTPGEAREPQGIPEDPESPPPGAPPTRESPRETKPVVIQSWGTGSIEPDTQTAVMLVLDDQRDYQSVLDFLARSKPFLEGWVEKAREHTGFVMEDPLCGAYLENADGQEEWNPDHELCDRVAQMMLLRRFGQQPYWLVQGFAWEAEMAYDGSIWCYPYRTEFVFTAEHSAWPSDLRAMFKDRAQKPLQMVELATLQRGRYDGTAARFAWGLVHYLALSSPAKLPAMLEDMRVFRDGHNQRKTGESTWVRIDGYEIPLDRQLEFLRKHAGADVMKSASLWLRRPDDPKKDEKKPDKIEKKAGQLRR